VIFRPYRRCNHSVDAPPERSLPLARMLSNRYSGPAMTLGNMRENGVHWVKIKAPGWRKGGRLFVRKPRVAAYVSPKIPTITAAIPATAPTPRQRTSIRPIGGRWRGFNRGPEVVLAAWTIVNYLFMFT
jgi:hypothetical protein